MTTSNFTWSASSIETLHQAILSVQEDEKVFTMTSEVPLAKQSDSERLQLRVDQLQLQVHRCIGDGACLFRALSLVTSGTEDIVIHILCFLRRPQNASHGFS